MTDNFQKEIPKARINITLDVETHGARRKHELPLKLLVLGDFSNGTSSQKLAERERLSIHKNNFDQIMAALSPQIKCTVKNTFKKDNSETQISLQFHQLQDFHPDHIVRQVPVLNRLLAMRNLLRDLRANIIDNKIFRQELEKIIKDKHALCALQQELKKLDE